jgi:hypothetical protein
MWLARVATSCLVLGACGRVGPGATLTSRAYHEAPPPAYSAGAATPTANPLPACGSSATVTTFDLGNGNKTTTVTNTGGCRR